MDDQFSSEEEKAKQELIRQEEEKLRQELARKWTEERLPEAEKIFKDTLEQQIYSSAYHAELSKNGLNYDPPGWKQKQVTPGEAVVTAHKVLDQRRADFYRDDQKEYIEQGIEADAATKELAREKARDAEAAATEQKRKKSEQAQQEKAQLLTPSKRVSAVQDMSALEETERQLAAQLAARQRDENFVETAREITERKVGHQPNGGGLEKSEEKQLVEATQEQAAKGQVEEKQAQSFAEVWAELQKNNKNATRARTEQEHDRER